MKRKTVNEPKVTVLMSVFNGAQYLRDSIDSILGQSFQDFEFLILNDGSNDDSDEIIRSYGDKRIRYVHDGTNRGLVERLNQGISISRGEYIVRMDDDDISLPERIEKQVKFMDANPSVGICGTWSQTFGEEVTGWETKYPVSHDEIKVHYLFSVAISHPTSIFRKSLFDKHNLRFSKSAKHYEDYQLFSIALDYFKFANIPEVLFKYRINKGQVGAVYSQEQYFGAKEVRKSILQRVGLNPSEEELELHGQLATSNFKADLGQYIAITKWLNKIWKANNKSNYYDKEALKKIIYPKWAELSNINKHSGFNGLYWYLRNQMFQLEILKDDRGLMTKFIVHGIKHFFKS